MFSIQSLPGPSCPCTKSQELTHNDSDSHQLTLHEAEPSEIHKPNFSIRDYVLRSRNKGIAENWPFLPKLLQFCLKHGISDILPPIEPPNLVKSHLSKEEAGFEQRGVNQEEDPTLSANYNPSDNVKPDSTSSSKKLVLDCSSNIHSIVIGNGKSDKLKSVLEVSSRLDVTEDPTLPENHDTLYEHVGRKSRSVSNLSAISESNQTEEISPISDSMASKICPVCKVFASSSNTTLNAHIDQCLSTESNDAEAIANLSKCKVSPRKKRLMVDIYAAAPHCTLEDLYRRNGTNWVSEMKTLATNCNSDSSILPSQNNEVGKETKRPKLYPEDIRGDGNEEKVYVDSNGIKLRILSKFSDDKHANNTKASKKPPIINKKLLQPRHLNDEKMDPKELQILDKQHSNYTDRHLEKEASECQLTDGCRRVNIQAAQNIDSHVDKHLEQEKPECQVINECRKVKINGFETLTKWVCSKRSDLHKKPKKNIHPISVMKGVGTQNARQEKITELPVEKKRLRKLSKSLKISTSFPKTKRMDLLCKPVERLAAEKDPGPVLYSPHWKYEDCSSRSLLVKLSRSTGKLVSSPRIRREEIDINTILQYDETCKHSPDVKKNVLKQNMPIETASFSSHAKVVKAHKHRLLSRNIKVPRFDIVHSVRGGTDDDGLDRRRGKALWIVQSDVSGSDISPRTVDGMSPSLSTSKGQESSVAEEFMKVEASVGDDDLPRHSIGNDTVLDTADTEVSNSEKLKHASIAISNQLEVITQGLPPQRDTVHNDVSENPIYTQSMETGGNIQVLRGTTLTIQGIANKDISHEKSSVTSAGVVSCMRRGSGSPHSTSSASFLCPPEDLILLNEEAQHANRPVELQDNQDLSLSRNPKPPPLECLERSRASVIKRIGHESPGSSLPKNHEQFSNVHPCCCFRMDSSTSDPHSLRADATRPCNYSPFYYGYSTPNDIVGVPAFGLPVQSSVKPSGDCVHVPTFCDHSSPTPSPRTQTMLRLMGKNLIVSSDAQAVNLPINMSDDASNVRCFSSLGVSSTGSVSNRPYHLLSDTFFGQQSYMDHVPVEYTRGAAPHQMRGMVSIDDCPEHHIISTSCSLSPTPAFAVANALHARPSSCFMPRQFQPRDFLNALSSSFPIPHLGGANTTLNYTMRGSTQGFATPVPRFPFSPSSAGHMQRHFYYSPTL